LLSFFFGSSRIFVLSWLHFYSAGWRKGRRSLEKSLRNRRSTTIRASETCRDHENTKVHEEHEKDLSFFFVIFADLRAFVVAFFIRRDGRTNCSES